MRVFVKAVILVFPFSIFIHWKIKYVFVLFSRVIFDNDKDFIREDQFLRIKKYYVGALKGGFDAN